MHPCRLPANRHTASAHLPHAAAAAARLLLGCRWQTEQWAGRQQPSRHEQLPLAGCRLKLLASGTAGGGGGGGGSGLAALRCTMPLRPYICVPLMLLLQAALGQRRRHSVRAAR